MRIPALTFLLASSATPFGADGFVVLGQHTSNYGLGSLFDEESQKMVTSGVSFKNNVVDLTLEGQTDTDCYISVGDIRGFNNRLFESPQLCLYPSIFPRNKSPGIPQAVVTGIEGHQATLFSMDYFGDYDDTEISNPINLPYATFPVQSATDPMGGVYVALHPTGGKIIQPRQEGISELQAILDYLDTMFSASKSVVESPTIMKFNVTSGAIVWENILTTTNGRSTIAAVQYLESVNKVVVAGSSTGKGSYVGAGVSSTGDWDGYITLLDADSGFIDDTKGSETHLVADHSIRIQSQPSQDDFILGSCAQHEKIYILGKTTGKIDGDEFAGGFILKIDSDTLNILWRRQIVGMGVDATFCVADDDVVYVGGQVPAGINVDDPTKTFVSDNQDIWIAKVEDVSGDIGWIRQIDSRREDRLSGLSINQLGNVMLNGNAMDIEEGNCEIIIMSIDRAEGFHDWQNFTKAMDPFGIIKSDTDIVISSPPKEDESKKTTIIVVVVLLPVFLLLLVLAYILLYKSSPPAPSDGELKETYNEEKPHDKNDALGGAMETGFV